MASTKNLDISDALSFGWNTFKSNWKFWVLAWLLASIAQIYSMSGNIQGLANSSTKDSVNQGKVLDKDTYGGEDVTLGINNVETTPTGINQYIPEVFSVSSEDDNIGLTVATVLLVFLVALLVIALLATVSLILAAVQLIFSMGYINLTIDAARGNKLDYKTLLNHVSIKKAFRFLGASILAGLLVGFGLVFFIVPGIYFAIRYMFVGYLIVDKNASIGEAFSGSAALTKGVKLPLFVLGLLFLMLGVLGVFALFIGIYVVAIVATLSRAYVYNTLLKQTPELV
ncbi:hypothetical protein GW755_04120 [bacterium]|nr:hypothetical protein [bacterium]